jgi:hypothetical protein
MALHAEQVQELSTLASTSSPLSPIMPLTEGTDWLREYFNRAPAFVVGDDLGTCYCSCTAVILSALVLGTDSPEILAGVTSYPPSFVAAVCGEMKSKKLWSLPLLGDLVGCLRKVPTDFKHVQQDLNDVMESVWDAIWTPEAYVSLESLRQRVLYGGETQRWVDQDALDFFHLA